MSDPSKDQSLNFLADEKQWNRNFQQNEIILVYELKPASRIKPTSIPDIIEVVDPETNDSYAYIDCSGLTFSTKKDNEQILQHLFLLSRHLSKVTSFKILFILDNEQAIKDVNQFKQFLVTCPFIYLARNTPSSVGLVVVNHVKKDDQINPGELRLSFQNDLRQAKSDILQQLKDGSSDGDIIIAQFIDVLLQTKNYLVLIQKYTCHNIRSLLQLPSPPGFKVLKFCYNTRNFRFTNVKCQNIVWNVYKDNCCVHYLYKYADDCNWWLESQITSGCVEKLKGSLASIQYEISALPQRENHLRNWTEIVQSFSGNISLWKLQDYVQFVSEVFETIQYPATHEQIGGDTATKVEQRVLLLQICDSIGLDICKDWKGILGMFKFFWDEIRDKVLPKIVQNLDQEICTKLKLNYKSIVNLLSKRYGKNFINQFIKVPKPGIRILSDADSLLKTLRKQDQNQKQENHILHDIYSFVWLQEKTLITEMFVESDELEKAHKQVEKCLSAFGEPIKCKTHMNFNQTQRLANLIQKSTKSLKAWDKLITEVESIVNQLTSQLEAELSHYMDRFNLKEKLDIVSKVYENFMRGPSLLEGVQWLSSALGENCSKASIVSKVESLQDELQVYRRSHQDSISWFRTVVGMAEDWKVCLNLSLDLVERLGTYQVLFSLLLRKEDSLKQPEKAILSVLQGSSHVEKLMYFCLHNCVWKRVITEIFYHALERETEWMASTGCLVVKGNNLILSDILIKLEIFRRKKVNVLKIFATNKVFIDQDFSNHGLDFIIVSPVVHVIGTRKISLRGKNGSDPLWPVANRGDSQKPDGNSGQPGSCGENGGSFYLLCGKGIGLELLTVDCSGGNGGPGQNGGWGHPGEDGRDANKSDLEGDSTYHEGFPGTVGGNGGNGGKGGQPGFAGKAEVEGLSHSIKCMPKLVVEDGTCGADGLGGQGGEGGKSGLGCKLEKMLVFWSKETMDADDKRTKAKDGEDGISGKNVAGMEYPTPLLSDIDIRHVTKSYLEFLASLNEEFSSETADFLEKLKDMLEFKFITPSTLLEELLEVDRQFESKALTMVHKDFKCKLGRYKELLTDRGDKASLDEIVTEIIDAYLISKAFILQDHSDGAHVVNLEGYLSVVNETVAKLKCSEVTLHRQRSLADFESHVTKKYTDIQDYISRILTPALTHALQDINEHFRLAASDLEQYKIYLENEGREIAKDMETLKTIQKFKFVFSILRIVDTVTYLASCCGFPGSGLIASFIYGATKAIKHQAIKYMPDAPGDREPANLPVCLQVGGFRQTLIDNAEAMTSQVETVTRYVETSKDPKVNTVLHQKLHVWKSHLKELKEGLETIRINSFEAVNFGTIWANVEQAREETLQAILDLAGDKQTMPKISNELQLLYVNIFLNKPRPSKPPKNLTVNQLMDPISLKKIQIATHQESIFHQMIPMVDHVVRFATSSAGVSGNIRIKKFEIQSVLKQLQSKIKEAVGGLQTEPKLIESLNKIRDGLTLLIDLHNDMDELTEKSKLVETFSKLSGPTGSPVAELEDSSLKNKLFELQHKLNSNMFQLDYKQALKAFRQWMFPFAKKFPLDDNWPEDRTLRDTDAMTTNYIQKFEHIRSILTHYKNFTIDFDSVVFIGQFMENSPSCPPFFVWSDKENSSICRLLNGKETEFKADLTTAKSLDEGRRAAIKFKSLRLNLIHKNGKEEQENLNKILEERYAVTMIHSGISHYRVFDEVFVMRGNRQEFTYSYDNKSQNMTLEKNRAGGEYLLSPYTVWSFRLVDLRNTGDNPLAEFGGKVSLLLEGDGWFVDEWKAKEKFLDKSYLKDLSDYYELVQ